MSRGRQTDFTIKELYEDMCQAEKGFFRRCQLKRDGTRSDRPRHVPPESTLDGQTMLIKGARHLSEGETDEMLGRRLSQSHKATGQDHLRARKTRDATEKERVKPKVISR